ncbi:DUF2993 domain-containing protein [Streptomyces sp. NPDC059740]|uniref:LmeA family phospholipid-binding protein n=1 Tax=Streptomyces sp. NPDC059740 TaxID=3346926 RepID=UPI0036466BB3
MRALRVLLVLVVVLAALFVAADRLAVNFAEGKAADKIRSSQGLDRTPEVSIKGFPFLTQLAGGTLDEVDASLDGIQAGDADHTLRVDHLSAQFHDVELTSDYSSIEKAGSATGRAEIGWDDLSKAAGNGVKVTYGGTKNGKGEVRITPNVPLVGKNLTVTGTLDVAGDGVRLKADSIPQLCRTIPGCEDAVRSRTDYTWSLSRLPGSLKLQSVKAERDGVTVTVSGTDVHL